MAPAKKSGTRTSARVRKPPSVAGDFEYDMDRLSLRSRAKSRRVGTKRVGTKKASGNLCACGICGGRVSHKGNYRQDCKYRIANNLKCDASGKAAASRTASGVYYGGYPCACGGSTCGRVKYEGNYRQDCAYRIANDLECDASGKTAEYDAEYLARPEVKARHADPFGGHQANIAARTAKYHLAALEARRKHKLWKESLDPLQLKLVEDAEAAIQAVWDAESERWAEAKIYANGICASLAKSNPELAFIFGREWVGTRLICADDEWACSAMRVKDMGGLLIHATNVAPDRLELVDGEPFMLRPSRKEHQWGNTKFVYGSLSNDASLPISFVEVHNGKRFVSLAREQPASNAVYLYILDQRHAQYEDFHQVYRRGGIITQAMRFFARCCKPVDVARDTPGVTVLKIFWKEGAPDVPYVEVLYGEPLVPDFSLNWDAASPEARAFSERAVARAAELREKRKAKLEGRAPPARKRKAPATAPPAKRSKCSSQATIPTVMNRDLAALVAFLPDVPAWPEPAAPTPAAPPASDDAEMDLS
ncbi:unnamed protein product [Pelagomonas calceolata]|uniref:Uncharacterized protein n=1 Tax=Pelagomonas calceolata TaxID=35677 RepID=A0A7S4E5V0_9STRA|nr:unnamed protein product [Pelagomonas calceolata]|mmetsp:Transcript_18964/g.54132  ORF Transcript_18964/g.54132 Transcript_18964/m.54132 type:complete len:535 (+) Transcript_18964:682-2286(+)